MNSDPFNRPEDQSRHGEIYEEIPFGVWTCDSAGGLQYASESFLELLGMSLGEASGLGWTKRIAKDDLNSVQRWKQCVKQGQDWDDEHRIRDQQGNMRTLLCRGHAVRNESGHIKHWVGIHLDITKRKEAEQRVEHQRNFAEAIIETVPVPLIVLDHEHRVVTANTAFYRHFRVQQETTEGTLLHRLGNGQWEIPALHRMLEETLRKDGSFDEYEVVHDFPHIGRKIMLVDGRHVERNSRHTEMILLAIRDVTDARQREDQLRNVQSTRAVQQERKRLARRLHDHMQQLLFAAKMHIGFAQQGDPSERSQDALTKAKTMVTDAIDASRDLAVELTPPVIFKAGLEAALTWIAEWMKEKHSLQIDLQIDSNIRLNDQHNCLVLFDALRELLLNVVKHAHTEVATVRIWKDGDWLRIVVRDQGTGFSLSEVRRKLATAAGFGLSSIEQSIQSVGGAFVVNSEMGHGTTIFIQVPFR